jgi:hypothetical protein
MGARGSDLNEPHLTCSAAFLGQVSIPLFFVRNDGCLFGTLLIEFILRPLRRMSQSYLRRKEARAHNFLSAFSKSGN